MNGIGWLALGIISIMILIFYFIIGIFVSYNYERNVGAHIENAFEVNTPERMIIEIQLAKDGMKSLNLDENMYGALIFKKPDNKMSWQYNFLDSVIERAEAVIIWRDTTYGGQAAATEQLGDVYEQKMDNLREFLHEGGRADWIAEKVYFVNNNVLYYSNVSFFIYSILIFFIILSFIIFIVKNE